MFIIFGLSTHDKVIKSGDFNCPKCCSPRSYSVIKRVRYFSLFFIPIIPIEKMAESVNCHGCKTCFPLKVLETRPLSQEDKKLYNLWQDLTSGMSLQAALTKLMAGGLSQEQANELLSSVTKSYTKACKDCKLSYIGEINACSNCGQPI